MSRQSVGFPTPSGGHVAQIGEASAVTDRHALFWKGLNYLGGESVELIEEPRQMSHGAGWQVVDDHDTPVLLDNVTETALHRDSHGGSGGTATSLVLRSANYHVFHGHPR